MFEFNSTSLDVDFGAIKVNDSFSHFRHEYPTPTDRFAWEITDVAVKRIFRPISSKRVMSLVAAKMAAEVSSHEPVQKSKPSLAEAAWLQYAAIKFSSPRKVFTIVGRRGTGKFVLLEQLIRQSENTEHDTGSQTFEYVGALANALDENSGEEPGEAKAAFVPSPELITAWLMG